MSRPPLSVVICAHSMERFCEMSDAIRSARDQIPPADEILLVVDHNHELLTWALKAFPDVKVVPNRNEPGLSGARNTGILETTGELLFFLDDDAVAEPSCLARLCAHLTRDDVLGVMSRIVPNWRGGKPGWFPNEFLWVVGCTYDGMSRGPVRNLIGASMLVRRRVFDAAGLFRSEFGRTQSGLPLGCEETEFCIRASSQCGGIFIFDDGPVVHHTVKPERGRLSYFLKRCYAEGLSKARLSKLLPSARSLSSERRYCVSVLPKAFLRASADGAYHLDRARLGAALAIVAGLGSTTVGFVMGTIMERSPPAASRGRSDVSLKGSSHKRGET